MDTREQIEGYLLETGDWISAEELCGRFGVTERQLRQVGGKPGLCSGFAISGDKGFRHITRATRGEWEHFYTRLRRHAIMEMVRVRKLRRRRHELTRRAHAATFEKDTPQAVMDFTP